MADQALRSAIEDELAALEKMVALLQQEQEVLAHARIDQLADITENKTRLVAELETLTSRRRAVMSGREIPDDGSAIAEWLATHEPATLPVWQNLIELARQAAQRNNGNRQLLASREEANRNLMRVLLEEQDAESSYSANGRLTHSAARRPLDRA